MMTFRQWLENSDTHIPDFMQFDGDPAEHPDFGAYLNRINHGLASIPTSPQALTSSIPSVRARKSCARLGISTLADLAKWDAAEFAASGRVGNHDLETCRTMLHRAGLNFKDDPGPTTAMN